MWDDLVDEIRHERKQLNIALGFLQELMEDVRRSGRTYKDHFALGAILPSFYNGFENIFKRVANELDGGAPHGDAWHTKLLRQMSLPGPTRPALISAALIKRMKKHLEFRHVSRSAYFFLLSWERMEPLALDCEATLRQFEQELDAFLASGPYPAAERPAR